MVMRALEPLLILPNAQVTVPVAFAQLPWLATAEIKPIPSGNVLDTMVLVAKFGPKFVTSTV